MNDQTGNGKLKFYQKLYFKIVMLLLLIF